MRSGRRNNNPWTQRLKLYFQDWNFSLRRDGLAQAFPGVFKELLNLPFSKKKFLIEAISLKKPFPDLAPDIELEIRDFRESDLGLIEKIERPSEIELCRKRLEHHHTGMLALYQGLPVGYVWASDHIDTNLERVHWRLQSGDLICLDVFTVPHFRGRGVMTALTLARFRRFQAKGFLRAVTYIDRRNRPSLAVWKGKLGSRTIGQLDYFRFGPWRRVKHTEMDEKTTSSDSGTSRGVDEQ